VVDSDAIEGQQQCNANECICFGRRGFMLHGGNSTFAIYAFRIWGGKEFKVPPARQR
jgi:hypothetical protein